MKKQHQLILIKHYLFNVPMKQRGPVDRLYIL